MAINQANSCRDRVSRLGKNVGGAHMITKNRILYAAITFQLTKECNAHCEICCESSGPQLNGKMDLDVILRSIDEIRDMNSIKLIAVTGGEPFLYPDDVLSIAKRCKEIGRKFTIITNAFWCSSYEHAFEVISQMKENNLAACFISADAFHQEYISIECVQVLLRACRELGIPTKIQANSTKSTLAETDRIINTIGMDKLHTQVLFGAAYPVGRAKEHVNAKEFFTRKLNRTVCQYQHILHISSDGKTQPCCSPCHVGIPFNFGNIYSDSLEDILKKVSDSELMRLITGEGLARLQEEAKKEFGFHELEEYVDVCHLCNHLLSDPDRYEYLSERAKIWKQQEDEIVNIISGIQHHFSISM